MATSASTTTSCGAPFKTTWRCCAWRRRSCSRVDRHAWMSESVIPHPHTRAALELRFGANYRWWVLLTVMVGTMASIMASTIINVAVPDISRVFHLGQERAQWLSAGFMASMTWSMLTTPWLLRRFGYRRTYVGVVLVLLAGGVVG